MPRGIPKKAAPAQAPVTEGPTPMVLIEPLVDGAIRLNGYGLEAGEVVDALRRSLIHLVAQRAGVQVISVEVPARAAVVAAPAAGKGKRPAQVDPATPRYSLASLGLDRDDEE